MQTPHSFQSCLYYKRRLNTYNFTLYDLGTSDGYSYIWNEATAGRGECEIASCVYNYIEYMSQQNGKEDIIFYFDNCRAQNKNRYYVTMLWYCLQKLIFRQSPTSILKTDTPKMNMIVSTQQLNRPVKIFQYTQLLNGLQL